MNRILIVEDNKISGSMIHKKISAAVNDPVLLANNLQEALALLDQYQNAFFAAFLDYVLPDAPNGEVIDEVIKRNISTVVFTAQVTDAIRTRLWKKGIVDYVIKDSAQSVNYLSFILARLHKNQFSKAMIVDDSSAFRTIIRRHLEVQNFTVLEAAHGSAALQLLHQNDDIKLVVTDNEMPEMNGIELTRKIRKRFGVESITIIGVTSSENQTTGAKFIKSGADDFINKNNFILEEFNCRINRSLENREKIELIRHIATTDDLTGISNRKSFYESAIKLYTSAQRSQRPVAFAIIDIDHFKQVNDTYGHIVGDNALLHVSNILASSLMRPSDLIGRFGGEEFVIFLDNITHQDAYHFFEKLRQQVQTTVFYLENNTAIEITISVGISTVIDDNIDNAIKMADDLLYRAKQAGRNKVMIHGPIT